MYHAMRASITDHTLCTLYHTLMSLAYEWVVTWCRLIAPNAFRTIINNYRDLAIELNPPL